jgi:hypothetical protein
MSDRDDPREHLKAILTPELVDCLGRLFPDRCPDPSTPDRQVWIDAGSAYVVRTLKTILEEIDEENLSIQKDT